MTSPAKELEAKIDQILKDPFLAKFSDEAFDVSDFIAKQLTSNNITDLGLVYSRLTEKDKLISDCLDVLVEQDPQFFTNQLSAPATFGVV